MQTKIFIVETTVGTFWTYQKLDNCPQLSSYTGPDYDLLALPSSMFSLLTEAQIAERKTREHQEKEHDIAVARELVNKHYILLHYSLTTFSKRP